MAETHLHLKLELDFWLIQFLTENSCLSLLQMKNCFCHSWLGMATCWDLSLKAISSSPKISWPVGFSISVPLIQTCYGTFGYTDKEWEKNCFLAVSKESSFSVPGLQFYTEICSLCSYIWSLGEGDELCLEKSFWAGAQITSLAKGFSVQPSSGERDSLQDS